MKWRLVYHDSEELGQQWRKMFAEEDDVEIIHHDICQVACDAIVSPANSFGFMDGGLDYLLSQRFGWDLQKRLQREISNRPMKELLVGEALIIETNDPDVPWLISAPTMRVPMLLPGSVNTYLAMKAILAAAMTHKGEPAINVVAIPGLGTGTGGLGAETAAIQMFVAYREIIYGRLPYPKSLSEAMRFHRELNP